MNYFTKIFIALLIALMAGCVPSKQPEPITSLLVLPVSYYVSLSGNDQNLGTQTSPFRTIQKCANVANLGNSCIVSAGIYGERVNVSRSGITFQAVGTAQTLGFTITGNDNVIDGFYVLNSTNGEGGIVLKGSRNIVKNNKVEGATLVGIQIQGTNHIVQSNQVLNTRARNSDDADGIRVFGDGHKVLNNSIILDYTQAEVNIPAHMDCFQTWEDSSKGVVSNLLLDGNYCLNGAYTNPILKGQGFMFDPEDKCGNPCNIVITNNVIRAYRGMYALNITGFKVSNNVFDTLLSGGSGIILQNVKQATITNNIFYNNASDSVSNCCSFLAPIQAGWNWNYRSDGGQLRGVKYSTDIWNVNPIFINPSIGDFHLHPTSPACRSGESGGYVGAFPCVGVGATSTVPASSTPVPPTVTRTVTPSPIIPTLTQSQTVTPTTPVSVTPTKIITPTVTPTPSPAPVCKWLGWYRILEWLRCIRG